MANAVQKRELLALQARLARLQIAAEQLKAQQNYGCRSLADDCLDAVANLADGLPSDSFSFLWKSAFGALKWKHRFLLGAGMVLWQIWRQGGGKNRKG